MKISILGYGPIPEKLAHELSQDAKVELFTSQKISIIGVPVHEYDSFLEKKLDFDVLVLAWRGLPKNGTQRADVLRYLVSNSPKGSLIINLSSVAVYGQNSSVNTEETEPHPINDYGYSKLFLERYLNILATSRVCNLRISNVFGHPNFDDVVNRTILAGISQTTMLYPEPKKIFRDFIFIDTLTDWIVNFINSDSLHKLSRTYNLSSDKSISLDELIQLIRRSVKYTNNYTHVLLTSEIITESRVSNNKAIEHFHVDTSDELKKLESYVKLSLKK